MPLPHNRTGLGINYMNYHDGPPDVTEAFLHLSNIIARVLEATAETDDAPRCVSNDVTGDVCFELSEGEGSVADVEDQVFRVSGGVSRGVSVEQKVLAQEIFWKLSFSKRGNVMPIQSGSRWKMFGGGRRKAKCRAVIKWFRDLRLHLLL